MLYCSNLIGGSKFRTSKVKNTRNLPLNARLPFPWEESGYETTLILHGHGVITRLAVKLILYQFDYKA